VSHLCERGQCIERGLEPLARGRIRLIVCEHSTFLVLGWQTGVHAPGADFDRQDSEPV